jgi:hypothetical protein
MVYDLQTAKAQQPKTLASPSGYAWTSSAAAAAPSKQQINGEGATTLENEPEKQQPKSNVELQQQQQQADAANAAVMKQHNFAVPPAHDDAVLAVSAHDRYPLLASGAMTADRKVLFWGPDDSSYTIPKTKHDNNPLRGAGFF